MLIVTVVWRILQPASTVASATRPVALKLAPPRSNTARSSKNDSRVALRA
ncbi:MAG: hypothetical protein ACK5RK_00130 [Betaproteobacteria bacterium]